MTDRDEEIIDSALDTLAWQRWEIDRLKGDVERLRGAIGGIKEAWDWWQVDTYDRCASVVDDAIRAAMGKKQ